MAERETIDPAEKAYAEATEKVTADKPAAVPAASAKPAPTKVETAEPKANPVSRAAAPKPRKPARKAVKAAKPTPATKPTPTIKTKDTKPMATTTQTKTTDFTAKLQTAVKDAQGRAKAAIDKGQAQLADAGEISKGNLEALVESGKILGSGLQAMTQSYVEEVKSAFAMVQDDVRALAAVKSPSEFVELRREQLRKYFDHTVAYNSKNAEAALKLASEAFQPLSNRVALAVEKFQKAA